MTAFSARALALGFLLISMGAEQSQGCDVELESDGTASAWEFAEVPERSEPLPMTCEWLETDN